MLHILYLYCIYVCGYIGGMAKSLCMYVCMVMVLLLCIPRYFEGSVPSVDNEDDLHLVDDDVGDAGARTDSESRHSNSTSGRSPFSLKYKKLTAALCEVVDDFGLVSFLPVNIQDKQVMAYNMKYIHTYIKK